MIKQINCLIIVILIILYLIYNPLQRYLRTKIFYKKAKLMSKEKNKKLMVIGDPCTGNYSIFNIIQKIYPNCLHGDITIDLFGCDACDKMDINDINEWKKYNSNEYVIIETATLSFGKDMKKILREIKRISGGDFFSAGGTTSLWWKYIGNKIYSKKYKGTLQNMIYPFDSSKDKYYKHYKLNSKETIKIDWQNL